MKKISEKDLVFMAKNAPKFTKLGMAKHFNVDRATIRYWQRKLNGEGIIIYFKRGRGSLAEKVAKRLR